MLLRRLAAALIVVWALIEKALHLDTLAEGNAYVEAQEAQVEADAEAYAYYFTEEEEAEMMAVAYLEGGHTGINGICMIYRVILNRVESDRWPNTIHEVLFQPGQFAVVHRIDNVTPNEDCRTALEMIKRGWDESNGVMHFWGDGRQNHFY